MNPCDPFANVDPSATHPLVRVTDCTGKPTSRTYRTLTQARRAVTRALLDPSTAEVYAGASWHDGKAFFDERCVITVKGSKRTYIYMRRDFDPAERTGYPVYVESAPTVVETDLPQRLAA